MGGARWVVPAWSLWGPRPGGGGAAKGRSWVHAVRGCAPDAGIAGEPGGGLERLARTLPAEAPGAGELSRWMARTGAELGTLTVPVRPLHGDLAPSNCFVHRGRMLVVDWEGEVAQGSPLAEVLLFLNHYARAVPDANSLLRDPRESFQDASPGQGQLNELTGST